jgi:hypothetical protein
VHEPLLHLLSQLARGEALDGLPYWRVQGMTPLLQTQAEALEAGPLLWTGRLLQDVFHTGNLDIEVADLA